MKKILFIKFFSLIGFFFLLPATAQEHSGFTLSCQIKGLPDGAKVYLRTQEKDTISIAISKGEKFVFDGKLPRNGRFHFIVFDSTVSSISSKAIFLINGPMSLSGVLNERDVIVKGSPAQIEYDDLVRSMADFKDRISELNKGLKTLESSDARVTDSSSYRKKRKELLAEIKVLAEEQSKTALNWIPNHLNSLYTPYLISACQLPLGLEKMQSAYNELAQEVKESYYGNELKNNLENMRLAATIHEGSIIPNFSITMSNGEKRSVHEIAGESKLTLIDCWASWCSPCRAEIPNLKKVYADYKDKGFNILGVSTDKREADWRKALAEDKTEWLHGLEDRTMTVAKLFGLRSIPAYILIDNKGKLIAFDCAMSNVSSFGGVLRGEDIDKILAGLLNK